MKKGRLIIFTGNGRGKTSAAFGLVLRALGRGKKVYLAQFMKSKPSGETLALKRRKGVKLESFGGKGFVRCGNATPRQIAAARRGCEKALGVLGSRRYDLVVLDEVVVAFKLGLLSLADLLKVAREKRGACHLVLTGRGAPGRLVELADDVTVMKKVKHSFDRGRKAEKGLEY